MIPVLIILILNVDYINIEYDESLTKQYIKILDRISRGAKIPFISLCDEEDGNAWRILSIAIRDSSDYIEIIVNCE